MLRYSVWTASTFVFLFFLSTHAEVAPCRRDGEYCSCMWAEEDGQKCWKQTASEDGGRFQCEDAPCAPSGWMCSCEDREYVCPIRQKQTPLFLEGSGGVNLCRNGSTSVVEPPVLRLGSFEIGLSRKGMHSNACNELVLWHNGDLVVNFGAKDNPTITCANADEEIRRRSNYTAVELQRGDLIAFRFKKASYHCFTSIAKFRINGRYMSSVDDEVVVRYARQYSTNWFSPSFIPVYPKDDLNMKNVTEETEPASVFVPLRRKLFSTGEMIPRGEDFWHPPDGTQDHSLGNFYFRIQL
ncbi:unnamed protein product [Agarophyton chilense]